MLEVSALLVQIAHHLVHAGSIDDIAQRLNEPANSIFDIHEQHIDNDRRFLSMVAHILDALIP